MALDPNRPYKRADDGTANALARLAQAAYEQGFRHGYEAAISGRSTNG